MLEVDLTSMEGWRVETGWEEMTICERIDSF
jgi:hypothetical protein